MRPIILAATAVALVLAAPTAVSQEIRIEIGTEHPGDHSYLIPESRRLDIPMIITVTASDFACAQPAPLTVQVTGLSYPDHWAGSSFNPDSVSFTIPQLSPGLGGQWQGMDDTTVRFDIFWDEDRPPQDARQTYTFSTQTRVDAAACLPPPGQVEEASGSLTAYMQDQVIETATAIPRALKLCVGFCDSSLM